MPADARAEAKPFDAKPLDLQPDVVATGATVSTLAGGCGQAPGDQTGSATSARFNGPRGLAFAIALYVADTGNHRIRAVDVATGTVTHVAGTGTAGASVAKVATNLATFSSPQGVAVDPNNAVLVADTKNRVVRSISAGSVEQLTLFSDEVQGVAAGGPYAFASVLHQVIRIDAMKGTVTAGTTSGFADQSAGYNQAKLNLPTGLAAGSLAASVVYVADTLNNRLRAIGFAAPGYVSTLAGTGTAGFADGGPGTGQLSKPEAVAHDPVHDRVFIADTANHRIRVWSNATKALMTIAGSTAGYQNGPGASALFSSPAGIAVVPGQAGKPTTIYVADTGNHCLRVISLP